MTTPLRSNRSMPPGLIIPVLGYRNLRAAVEWLCHAFGFTERLRVGDHRVQLTFGHASVVAVHACAPRVNVIGRATTGLPAFVSTRVAARFAVAWNSPVVSPV